MTMILVVDGDASHAGRMKALLESYRCAVLEAGTALSAMRIINDHTPDLVLVDMALPGIDGITMVKLLKTNPRTSRVPVIVLAESPTRQEKEQIAQAGCNHILNKSCHGPELVQAMQRYIRNNDQKALL
jgi:CheY-like chemotaxis protein